MTGSDEFIRTTRFIPAPPAAIFEILRDPERHPETEPGHWVREAIDPAPLAEVGQVFGMNMYLEQVGGPYVMHNRVAEFEEGRLIAWQPGQLDDEGRLELGGWLWRYELTPVEGGTAVALTYDWSRVPQRTREEFGGRMPPFDPVLFDESLEALARAVRG
jgi:uncharacterized protein YndB with AHSA1/START domain